MDHDRFEQAFEELTAYAALLPVGELWKKSITSMADQLFPDPGDRKALIPRLRDGLRTLHNQLRDDPEWESGRWEIEKLTARSWIASTAETGASRHSSGRPWRPRPRP